MALLLTYVLSAGAVYALVTFVPRLIASGRRRGGTWNVGPGIARAVFDPGGWLTVCTHNARILVYEIESRRLIGPQGGIPAGPPGFHVTAMALGMRGGRRFVATAGGFGEISVREISAATRSSSAKTVRAEGAVSSLFFSPHSDSVLIGDEDGRVWQWSWDRDEPVRQHIDLRHIYGFSARKDGSLFAAVADGSIGLWNPSGNGSQRIVDRPGARCAAFSPRGRTLAVGGGTHVTLLDVDSGLPRETLNHAGVFLVEYSPDGKALATVASDGIRIWAADTGAQLSRESHFAGTIAIHFQSARTLQSIAANGAVRQVYVPDTLHPASARTVALDPDDVFKDEGSQKPQDDEVQPRIRRSKESGERRPLVSRPGVLAASLALGAIPVGVVLLRPAKSPSRPTPPATKVVEWVAPPKTLRFDRRKVVIRPPAAKKNAPSKTMTVYFIPPEEQRITQKPPQNPSPIDSAVQQIKGAVEVQKKNPAQANRKWATGAAILERWRPAVETYPGSIKQPSGGDGAAPQPKELRKEISERTATVRLLEAQAYERVADQLRKVAQAARSTNKPQRPIGEVLKEFGLDELHLEDLSPAQIAAGSKTMEQEAVALVRSVLKEAPDAKVTGSGSKSTTAREYARKNLARLYKKAVDAGKKATGKRTGRKRVKRQ